MEVSNGSLSGLHKWKFHVNHNEIALTWNNEINKTNAYRNDSIQLLLFNISKKSFILVDAAKRAYEKINHTILESEKVDYVAWAL